MPDPFPGRTEITSEEWQAFVATTAPRRISAPRMRERDFRDAVVVYARLKSWLAYFTQRSDRSPAGFPDLVLCRGGRLIFAELKVGTNRPTAAQRDWLHALVLCDVEVWVWTPDDWDVIEEMLA